jgi:hypothetical protein
LTACTTYHVRAYATNSAGTSYGTDIVFTTSCASADYLMNNDPVTTCSGSFFDSGGQTGNYSDYEDFIKVFTPAISGNKMQFNFSSFSVEPGYDNLYIYDGPDISSPQIAGSPFNGNQSIGIITASAQNTSGAITFHFTSDYSVNYSGWEANISCIPSSTALLATPTIGTITQPTCNVSSGSVVVNDLPASGTWTLTRLPDGTTKSGTGTSSTISGLEPGTYSFTVTNATGSTSATSANVVINAQPSTPPAPIIGTITQPICNTKGSVILNGLPSTGTWTVTSTLVGETTSGSGTSTNLKNLNSGSYTFSVTNSTGCTSPSSLSVLIQESKPVLIPKIKAKWNDILICYNKADSIESYKWYRDNTIIVGATKKYYETKTQKGAYMVEITDLNGCTNLSNVISIADSKSILVYPNPASISFDINLNSETEGKANVSILNSNGRKVIEYQIDNIKDGQIKEIPVSNLSEGTYIIYVVCNNEVLYYSKVLVIK